MRRTRNTGAVRRVNRRRLTGALAASLLLTAALAGCSGSGSDSKATSGGDAAAGSMDRAPAASGDMASAQASAQASAAPGASGGGSAGTANRAVTGSLLAANDATTGRDIIRTAALTVRVRSVPRAADRAETLATGAGGIVFGEQSSADPRDPTASRTVLVLKVPPAGYGDVIRGLGGLGTVLEQKQSAQDVTAQMVDVESRVASQRRTIAQLRALLDRANTVGEVIKVEGELSGREAALESLEAQRKQLAEQTALATVTVTLVPPDAPIAVAHHDRRGFGAGLDRGWHGFRTAVVALVTLLGLLLPFLVLLAALAVPTWWLTRRLRGRPGAPSAPATSDAGSASV